MIKIKDVDLDSGLSCACVQGTLCQRTLSSMVPRGPDLHSQGLCTIQPDSIFPEVHSPVVPFSQQCPQKYTKFQNGSDLCTRVDVRKKGQGLCPFKFFSLKFQKLPCIINTISQYLLNVPFRGKDPFFGKDLLEKFSFPERVSAT